MVALRLYAVGLLLMPVRAEAAAPWNSTDMSYKSIADKKTQAQKASELHALRTASSTADSLLSGNKTILVTMKEEKKKAEDGNYQIAHEIGEYTKKLQQALTDQAQKGNVLNESIENVAEATASVNQATAALSEAETANNTATSANQAASRELWEAENNLQQKVICCAAEVPAAKANVELKKTALNRTSAALAEAERVLAAKKKALKLAKANYTEDVSAREKAQQAYQDAVALVKTTNSTLNHLKEKDASPQEIIDKLTAAVFKQDGIVKTLNDASKELHEKVAAKKREYDNITAVVKKDVKCISRLQAGEGTLSMDTLRFKKAADAYEAAPAGAIQDALKPALWELKDQEDAATLSLWEVQKDCAPQNITLPEKPDVTDCPDDTGGTCGYFNCHPSRNAKCCDKAHTGQPFCLDGPNYKCLCPAGTCAIDGVCQDRGSPVLLASPSTELRAEPAAAGTVLLAAAALTVTALLGMRKRRAPEIHMPEHVLG